MHTKWKPTQVRKEIFNELDKSQHLSKKEKMRLEILMAQTDVVIEEIIEDSKTSIFNDFHKASAKERSKILNYLFRQM